MSHRLGCRPDEHPRIGRRQLLQAGGLSLFGMTLGDLFASGAGRRGQKTAQQGEGGRVHLSVRRSIST